MFLISTLANCHHSVAWFVGHLTLLLCVARYGLSYLTFNYYSKTALFTYRTAFVSAAATYGIVVYKSLRARAKVSGKQPNSPLALAADENVQYLGMFSNLQVRIWSY